MNASSRSRDSETRLIDLGPLAILLLLFSPLPSAHAALRQVRVVAVSGTEAPGTALNYGNAFDIRDFYLSPDGDVVFGAPLAGMLFDYGFWRWGVTGTTLLARHGAAAAETDGFYDFSNGPSRFGSLGYWNFHGLLSMVTGGRRSVWLGAGSGLSRIAGEDGAAPFVADGLFANLPQSLATRPTFGGVGVTFIATLKDGPETGSSITSENDSGIWSGNLPSGLGLVAREDEAMPGLPGQKFANFGRPIMSPLGVVWFTANAKPPASNDGLFRWSVFDGLSLVHQRSDFGTISKITVSPSDDLQFIATVSSPPVTRLISHDPLLGPQTVATIGQPSPDRDGQPLGSNFAQFLHHILPATRRTVLLATTAAGWRGIWREDGSVLTLLVRNGDPAVGMAGNQTLLSITQVAVNEDGLVVFEATTSGTAGSTGWWKIGDDGATKPLILPGDTIQLAPGDIRTVTTVKGPIVNGGNPSELGIGYDGVPTHVNREDVLLQVSFNNFTSSALVLAQGAEFLVVNSTGNDDDDTPGDGVCDTGGLVDGVAECTLRAAIMEANALADANTIRFDIPADDPGFDGTENAWIIRTQGLQPPDVLDSTTIDATTQPGYAGVPRVVLDGTGTRADEQSGLILGGGTSEVRGISIVAFAGHGIHAAGGEGHHIRANYVGVLPSGTAKGNNRSGIEVLEVPGVTIGGMSVADRNIISGNDPPGGTIGYNVHISGAGATGTVVIGNHIGTDPAGQAPLGGRIGVNVEDAADVTIGGDTAEARNVISGNSTGIDISGLLAVGNRIRGNYIGVGADGVTPVPNLSGGITVTEGTGTSIGGFTDVIGEPPGNVISGNASNRPDVHGIRVSPRAHGTVIEGNLIGLDASGGAPVPNGGDGVHLNDADSLRLGALDERGRNVISGNDSSGVVLELGRGHRVYSNIVGLSRDQSVGRGNGGHGIHLVDTPGADIYENIVGANERHGVTLEGVETERTRLERNWIGTDPLQTRDYGNRGDGVRISGTLSGSGPDSTFVGNDGADGINTIWFNGEAGVRLLTGSPHRMRRNSFYRNEALGIDLSGPGVTQNDKGDIDFGPNFHVNFPVLTRAGIDTSTATLRVRGALASGPGLAFAIDIYGSPECDPSGYGEGRTWLASLDVTTGSDSTAAIDLEIPLVGGPAAWPSYLTAMATGSEGTSEFSACITVDIPDRQSTALIVNSTGDAPDLDPGDGICSTGATTGGEPECTLRAALQEAAALAGAQTVRFDIDGAPPYLIRPAAPLPAAADVEVDGTTQPGYVLRPVVGIDAATLPTGPGITLAGGAAVWGLAVYAAPGDGFHLTGSGNSLGWCDSGLDPATGGAAPNGRHGVHIESSNSRIGGPAGARPNRIAYNGGDGVRVTSGTGNEISGNALFDNGGLGINLVGGDETAGGVTANDPGDGDEGANQLINRPGLTLDLLAADRFVVIVDYSGAPATRIKIEVFSSTSCDPSGAGEGATYLGVGEITTNQQGTVTSELSLDYLMSSIRDRYITATATDEAGNSSEFADCQLFPAVPVILLAWSGRIEGGRALLSWSIRDEGGLVGFHVWRRPVVSRTGSAAPWELRTEGLLSGFPDAAGDATVAFRFDDAITGTPGEFEYRLEGVTRTGMSEFLGPFLLTVSPPEVASLQVLANPVSERVSLAVDLPAPGPVRVLIHDVQGRLRRILSAGDHPAGRLQLDWDLTDGRGLRLPAGLYLLRLSGAPGIVTRVLVLK